MTPRLPGVELWWRLKRLLCTWRCDVWGELVEPAVLFFNVSAYFFSDFFNF